MEQSPDSWTEETLMAVCVSAFPSRRVTAVSGLVALGGGWECDVRAFVVTSEEDGRQRQEPLILRVYQGDAAGDKAAAEYQTLENLTRAGYPVPRAYYLDRGETGLGKPFIVMERIVGPDLGQKLKEAGGTERGRLLQMFCALYVQLHSLDWHAWVTDASEHLPGADIDRWLAVADATIDRYGATDLLPIVDWLHVHRSDVKPLPPVPTHGDFHAWNILVRDEDGQPSVIDWTNADIADFRFDLAWTLLLMSGSSVPMRDEILQEYERQAGAAVESLDYFEVVASGRRIADILLSLQYGPEALGMRADTVTIMAGNLCHLKAAADLLFVRTGIRIGPVESLLWQAP